MSLLPYFYDFDRSLRMMDRDYFSPDFYSSYSPVPRDFFSPSFVKPWNVPRSWDMFQPLERLSEAVNRLAVKDSNISVDGEKFQVNVDVQHFSPEEINVKVINGQVVVEGKHEEKRDQHGYISRQFVRKYSLPEGCLPDTVESSLSSDGVLTVTAPKVLALPSTGEKIIPVSRTGPIRKEVNSSEFKKELTESTTKQNGNDDAEK